MTKKMTIKKTTQLATFDADILLEDAGDVVLRLWPTVSIRISTPFEYLPHTLSTDSSEYSEYSEIHGSILVCTRIFGVRVPPRRGSF